ncbi:MAG: GAF domain-containing protein [Leptolyngbyaceae cyanobacterium SM1_3_5]|nr:GAF domain-containing protein [Leptolyngbyaceae cyanobacterium SM1_3_5]
MSQAVPQVCSLNQILITEVLFRRVPRSVNLEAEHHALLTLTQQLAEKPQILLKSLVGLAVELCNAGSAGISIPEVTASGDEIFRWVALAGRYANATQAPPRYFSLCGHCLDQRTPQLYAQPERYFTYFESVHPRMVECLVVPLLVGEQALGTIWVVSHEQTRQFDLEDVRVMSSLAKFTAAALNHTQARYAAEMAMMHEQAARQEAEQATRARDEFLQQSRMSFGHHSLTLRWRSNC